MKTIKCPKCGSIHVYWSKVFQHWHCAGLSFSCGYSWKDNIIKKEVNMAPGKKECEHDWVPFVMKMESIRHMYVSGQEVEFKACIKCGKIALTNLGIDKLKPYH
jgi:hypothetical protein